MKTILNFIDGNLQKSFSDKTFNVKSPFYNYSLTLTNSDDLDLALALSCSNKSKAELDKLNLSNRVDILEKAYKKFKLNPSEIEYVTKMTGITRKQVLSKASSIKHILKEAYELTKKRYMMKHDMFLHHNFDNTSFVYKRPIDKLTCVFLPGNDISVSTYILAHIVLSGSRIIIKPSSEEPYFAIKIAKLLSDCGYPSGAINVLLLNTEDNNTKKIINTLINETDVRVVFGDDSTIDLLRGENLTNGSFSENSGTFVLYGTGRSKALVYKDIYSIPTISKEIAQSSLNYYIGCTSLKAVLIHEDIYEKMKNELINEFNKMCVSNPLNDKSDIGYSKDIDNVISRINESKRFGTLNIINDSTEKINNWQTKKPIILEVYDIDSEFLKEEYPIPILALFKYKGSLADGISLINKISKVSEKKYKSLAVSVYLRETDKYDEILKINAYHININTPTTFQNIGLPHQGKYLKDVFTEEVSVNIN